MKKWKKLVKLFATTSAISATTNGGYAILAAMKSKFVEEYHWFDEEEMIDLVAIAQTCPGPMAVNASILVGYREVGVLGAIVTVLGTVSPPLIIMTLATIFYQQIVSNELVRTFLGYMASGVAAMLIDVTFSMFISVTKKHQWYTYAIIASVFLLRIFTDVSILWIALGCIVLGLIKARLTLSEVKNDEH